MNRRTFLRLVGLAPVAAPSVVRASLASYPDARFVVVGSADVQLSGAKFMLAKDHAHDRKNRLIRDLVAEDLKRRQETRLAASPPTQPSFAQSLPSVRNVVATPPEYDLSLESPPRTDTPSLARSRCLFGEAQDAQRWPPARERALPIPCDSQDFSLGCRNSDGEGGGRALQGARPSEIAP